MGDDKQKNMTLGYQAAVGVRGCGIGWIIHMNVKSPVERVGLEPV